MSPHWPTLADHPAITDDEAHIWALAVDPTAADFDSIAELLSQDEVKQAIDFRLPAPRQRFVTTRAALRILLGRYLNTSPTAVEITVDLNKKPRLANTHNATNLRFNVAHSGSLALIAVTKRCEIGIDVEQLREVRHAEQIALKYFHPREIESILTAPRAQRDATFMRCWTAKEAVLKALGTGIIGSLAEFNVPANSGEHWTSIPPLASSPTKYTQLWLRQLDVEPGYAAAVAIVGLPKSLRCLSFAW